MKLLDPDIATGSWEDVRDGVQRDLDAIATLMPGFGGKSVEIRYGTATLAFSASATAAVGAVAHGLGRAPQAIALNVKNVTNFNQIATLEWHNATTTTFDINGLVPAAITANVALSWIAIG